ncbi:hypothetical protein GPECTOR_53g95 [Gonium pectorale]|uniref:Uncharacterized protein n=1 Tax=Gonium pectorale TaxID=33097 RepID=A0A150G6X7_GONPE|nr:hypothetical protein GPECTOR_53g95 [Gonium pectorale]|eukprot:KXZ45602.1 hypothetical protein GPECTOR_53g95 [Gonium pectorale]
MLSAAPAASNATPVEPDLNSARLDGARVSQKRHTDLLAQLLQASDPTLVARQNVEGLNEEFFMTAGTYLSLAQKEGNTEASSRLGRALTAAWDVKQSTLRPELQLLNRLVRTQAEAARREIYISGGAELVATLTMNDRWFAATLGRMVADVERQPPNPGKASLLSTLRAIQRETEALAAQAARQAARGQQP